MGKFSLRDTQIIDLIFGIGDNPNRPGLKDTPKRVVKAYKTLFRGYDLKKRPKMTTLRNGKDGVTYKGMIIDHGYFFSFCEHHFLPFFGIFFYCYIPDKLILGASKISRMIDYHCARLQVQERICYDAVEDMENILHPKGSMLVMRARHLCKEMRGVQKHNAPYETDEARGCLFLNEGNCKDEFLSRINNIKLIEG